MKPIDLSKGVAITKTRKGNSQSCIACGQRIGEGVVAISLHNYNDNLSLKKNLWLHINCVENLRDIIEKGVDDNKETITVESI